MVGRDTDKRRPHQRIGAGGIDGDRIAAVAAVKRKFQTTRFADPVFLHQPHFGRPVVEASHSRQQFLGEIADLEKPLGQFAPLDLGARPPALAVDHLFVGQHGHIDRVPVHHGILAVNQSTRHEIDEHRLLLAVIFGVGGGKLAGPVQRPAQRFHLGLHLGDIGVGPVARVSARGHCGVFGRHSKGIPPHRVQHRMPGRGLKTRDHVAHCIVAHVADVDAPRRIGKHLEHIILGPGIVAAGRE